MDEPRLPGVQQKLEGQKRKLEAKLLGHLQGVVDACAGAWEVPCGMLPSRVPWRMTKKTKNKTASIKQHKKQNW